MEEADPAATAAGLEWENLALFSAKPQLQFSMSQRDLYRVPDPAIGLRLGRHKDYGGPTPTKRSRASYHNMQNPCCQVEGCNLDLKLAKDYHRRHRICETHSKSPKVVVAGMERRFCQQCSRFHDLSEFDDKKRSCRRRLSDHNARRRRVQPDSIHLTSSSSSSSGISPALYTNTTTDQRQQSVLLNGLPVSLSNSSWENSNAAMPRHALLRPSKDNDVLHMDPHPRILDQCLHHVPTSTNNSSMAPDLLSAHSLLSSNSWSLNEAEPSASIEGIVQGSYSRHSEPDSHHFTLFHTADVALDQASLLHSVNMHNAAPSHQQEYHLFKSPYNSTNFYSTQRTL